VKNLTTLLFAVLLSSIASAQLQDLAGAAGGLAGAVAANEGGYMSFHNQAGTAAVDKWEAGLFWENRFLSNELNNRGFYAVLGLGKSRAVGFNYRSFGYELIGSSRAGLSYAMAFSPQLSAGIQLDYYQLRFGDIYGKRAAVSFQGGAQYKPSDQVVLAFHITNPLGLDLDESGEFSQPQKIDLAAKYIISEKAEVSAQFEKYLREVSNLRLGINYGLSDALDLRVGYATFPSAIHLGLGFQKNGLAVHVASAWYQTLGFSPQIGLSYAPQ